MWDAAFRTAGQRRARPSSRLIVVRFLLLLGLALAGPLPAADDTAGSGPVTANTLLTSGVPASFTLPAVDNFTLFNGNSGFRIAVPNGATSFEVRLAPTSGDADIDLYVRRGTDVVNAGYADWVADYRSEGFTAFETITITPSSTPPLTAGTYYIALVLYSSETPTSGTVTATLSGVSSAAVNVTPASLDFGNVTPGQSKDLPVTVLNGTAAAVTITSAGSSNGRFTVISPSVPFPLAPGAQQAITIRFAPNAVGQEAGTLIILTTDATSSALNVSLQGTGAAAVVDVTPTSLDFGSVTTGQAKSLQATVRNGTSAEVTIKSISSSNARFSVTSPSLPFTLSAGADRAVQITFSPLDTGLQTGVLTISTSDAARPTLSVSLRGTGAASGGGGNGLRGLVAWWTFDEGSGVSASDSSGNNNTGTLFNGPSWTTGRLVGALSFDGVDDYVGGSDPGVGFPIGAAPRTISAWIKAPNPGGTDRSIFHYGTNDVAAPSFFHLSLGGDGKPVFGNALRFGQVAGTSRVDDNTWHHIVGVYEGTATNVLGIYVDGARNGIGVLSRPPDTGTGSNWSLGSFINGGGPFRGLIDDVRLYDRVLFDTEIGALFAEGGGAPGITVDTLLDFGTVNIGQTVDSTLTVRNVGIVALTVSSLSLSSQRFQIISPAVPFKLAAGAQRDITLRFQPDGAGTHTGILSITSNDPVRPSATITLTGTGTVEVLTPRLGISATSSLTFNVEAGAEAASGAFTVSNTGGGSLDFQVTTNQPWLSASPARGTSTGAPVLITITVRVPGLDPGNYAGEIRISQIIGVPAGSPQQSEAGSAIIPVQVTVLLAPGAPVIAPARIVNAASFASPGLPRGAIARGSIFSIFGSFLGPSNLVAVSAFPLQASLAGVSVKVTGGGGGAPVDAIPLAAVATQINAIMPSNAPLGEVSVRVTFGGRTSLAVSARIVDTSVGLFALNQNGMGPGVLQNFILQDEQPVNSPARSARPGQLVTLWGTGLGPINGPDNVAPPIGDLPFPVEIWVGGKRVIKKAYSGRSPCCAGLDQIVFEVPADAPQGCFVPVLVRGNTTSNAVTMAIEEQGRPCSDVANPLSKSIVGGGKQGLVSLRRINVRGQPNNAVTDLAAASFTRDRPPFDPYSALPPVGSCSIFTGAAVDLKGVLGGHLPGLLGAGQSLDAGARLMVIGPGGVRSVQRSTDGVGEYFSSLGGTSQTAGTPDMPLFLDPGPYMVTGPGGADVGPFTANVTIPSPFKWINPDQLLGFDRRFGATVFWSGGDAAREVVTILGWNPDPVTKTAAAFLCVAPLAGGSFSVPGMILETLPSSAPQSGPPTGFLFVGTMPSVGTPTFTASGLDAGLAFFTSLNGLPCTYR